MLFVMQIMKLAYMLAALIPAAILLTVVVVAIMPQQLQAQSQDGERTQITGSKTYPVEIVSTELIDEYASNVTKVQLQKQTVELIDKPTYEELVALNQEHFDFLISEFGEEGKRIVAQKKQEIREGLENAEQQFEVDVVTTDKLPAE